MQKPTYYLWQTDYADNAELEQTKMQYKKSGFRVVVFSDGKKEKDIHEGLKYVIHNHI